MARKYIKIYLLFIRSWDKNVGKIKIRNGGGRGRERERKGNGSAVKIGEANEF